MKSAFVKNTADLKVNNLMLKPLRYFDRVDQKGFDPADPVRRKWIKTLLIHLNREIALISVVFIDWIKTGSKLDLATVLIRIKRVDQYPSPLYGGRGRVLIRTFLCIQPILIH